MPTTSGNSSLLLRRYVYPLAPCQVAVPSLCHINPASTPTIVSSSCLPWGEGLLLLPALVSVPNPNPKYQRDSAKSVSLHYSLPV